MHTLQTIFRAFLFQGNAVKPVNFSLHIFIHQVMQIVSVMLQLIVILKAKELILFLITSNPFEEILISQ